METVIIVIHLMVVAALVAVVLLQRSEGGALGIGGGGNFMATRGTGNVLTRTTAILAAAFFATSIVLTVLAKVNTGPTSILDNGAPAGNGQGILDQLPGGPLQTPAPAENAPAAGAAPAAPAAEVPSDGAAPAAAPPAEPAVPNGG